MSYLFLLAIIFLVIAAIVFVSDLINQAGNADPDAEDGDEEVIAMGGQVDDGDAPSEEEESSEDEPSEEEEPKS